jgi:hypothetical protein
MGNELSLLIFTLRFIPWEEERSGSEAQCDVKDKVENVQSDTGTRVV